MSSNIWTKPILATMRSSCRIGYLSDLNSEYAFTSRAITLVPYVYVDDLLETVGQVHSRGWLRCRSSPRVMMEMKNDQNRHEHKELGSLQGDMLEKGLQRDYETVQNSKYAPFVCHVHKARSSAVLCLLRPIFLR